MRICIVGAGAVGCLLAARLARTDCELSLLARGDTLRAIQRRGLQLIDRKGEHRYEINTTDDPSALGPQDHVRLAVGTEPPQVPSGPFGVGGPTEHQLVTLGHPGRRVELLGPGESQSGSPVVPSAATQTKSGWFPPVPVAKTIRVPAWVHTG